MPSSLTNNARKRDRGRVREISNEYNFKFYHFVQKVFYNTYKFIKAFYF